MIFDGCAMLEEECMFKQEEQHHNGDKDGKVYQISTQRRNY